MIKAGITPDVKAIRGGTDGARLSLKDCPVRMYLQEVIIFTGRMNLFLYLQYLKAVEVILNIAELAQKRK
jgi:tripeptide aminopeptidase